MEVIVNILFWLHLTGLAMGGAVAFGMPVVGTRLPGANAEMRPLLFSIAHGLSKIGRAAMALLIITGPFLIWLKFGGMSGLTWWFSLKMVLVILLIVGIVFSGILMKRAEAGDRRAEDMMPKVGGGLLVVLLAIVLAAVFAFN